NVVQRIARDALILAKKFMPEQQMVRMLDATGAVIFKELKRTDLVDAPEVFIEAGTLFQTDAEARERRVLDRLERGLITPEQAIDQLSFRQGGLDKVAEKVQALSHAGDMLQAVLRNHPIEIFASDDLVAFRRVFSEYTRTDEFYEQHPEIQNYIADIIAAIDTWGAGPEAYMQQRLMNKVWPVQFMPTMTPQEQAGGLAV